MVVVETVGVGQSETDVEEVCDTVAVVVQPGSGDTLQFLKAGIMEVPDVLVVTKADLGDVAAAARAATWPRRCASLGRARHAGAGRLVAAAAERHRRAGRRARRPPRPARPGRRAAPRARRLAALAEFAAEHGERGLRALGGRRAAERLLTEEEPDADMATMLARLEERAASGHRESPDRAKHEACDAAPESPL